MHLRIQTNECDRWFFLELATRPSTSIPLTPVEPEDFIHDICGKILCWHHDTAKDQTAGRFRIYYADFELGQNHNVSPHYILDAHQHTFDYAEVILDSDASPFSRRLHKLLGDIRN